jgi:hypothetical protein
MNGRSLLISLSFLERIHLLPVKMCKPGTGPVKKRQHARTDDSELARKIGKGNIMKKIAFVVAAVAAMALSAPAFADSVSVRVHDGHRAHAEVVKKKVVVRHDRGLHRGWEHNRGMHRGWEHNRHRTVVIKKHPRHVTVVKRVHKY